MPYGSFRSVFENSTSTVLGRSGTEYSCPDLATLDGHIAELHSRVGRSLVPELITLLRTDIDLLLERRIWLTQTAICATSADRRHR